MRYSNNIIDEIVEKNNIVSVIGEVVSLKKNGSEHTGLCPFHNEKTPSFHVSEIKQVYHCFGCGASGNIITFLMNYDELSFKEAIEQLAQRVGVVIPKIEYTKEQQEEENRINKMYEVNKEAAIYYYYLLKDNRGKKARDELKRRGIDWDTVKKFGLGYSSSMRNDLISYLKSKGFSDQVIYDAGFSKTVNGNVYDTFFDRIMFPIFNSRGKVIAFGGRAFGDNFPKYLNSKETSVFKKSSTLYGLNLARKSKKDYCLLVEGYMDVIALHQAGFNNAIASLGTAFTSRQALLVKKYFKKAIICYDSDEAGVTATRRAIPILKSAGLDVRVITVKDAKDPDEFIKKYGAKPFEQLIKNSKNAFLFEITCIEKKYDLTDPSYEMMFYDDVAKKLLTLDDKLEINSYLKKICDIYKIDYYDMEELVAKHGKSVGIASRDMSERVKKAYQNDMSPTKAENIILSLMIADDNIFDNIIKYIEEKDFIIDINKRIFNIVVEYKKSGEKLNAGKLISHFSDADNQQKVAHVFNIMTDFETKKDLQKLVNECYKVIKRNVIEKLTREASTDDELIEIVSLRKKLDETHISL